MKTIATAAVLMMLTAPVWAGEPQSRQANNAANTGEPIVLSEAELDGVSAGSAPSAARYAVTGRPLTGTSNTAATGENSFYGDFFGLDDIWTER